MALFGRKRKEEIEKKDFFESEPNITPLSTPLEPQKPQHAPLFVKVERYHEILKSMNELKYQLESVKEILGILRKIERIKDENMQNLHEVVGNLHNRLNVLDSEFLRPPGFQNEVIQSTPKAEQLDDILKDLRIEVNSLKNELKDLE